MLAYFPRDGCFATAPYAAVPGRQSGLPHGGGEGTSGKRAGFASWVLLFYALWHNHHILGRREGGDVDEALGEAHGGSRAA